MLLQPIIVITLNNVA